MMGMIWTNKVKNHGLAKSAANYTSCFIAIHLTGGMYERTKAHQDS